MAGPRVDDRGVLVTCPSCGSTNRLRFETLDRRTRCGRCHAALEPPAAPIEVRGAAMFDRIVGSASVPVLVDFWAAWCGPCRMVAPEVEKVARAMAGSALVLKVDTDAEAELSARFGIRSIPTLAVFRGGREVTRVAGVRPASDLQQLLSSS